MNSRLKCFVRALPLWLALSFGFDQRAGAALAADSSIPAKSYVVGLSPYLEKTVKDDVFRRLVRFLIEELPLGSSLRIYDAYHLQTVTQVEIPKLRAFQSPKTRANQFKEPIHKLKSFLATEPQTGTTNAVRFREVIRFPQFMDFVGANVSAPNDPSVVIVLGSPLYIDAKERTFSMEDGYFPSDGHLLAPREQSVFGVKDRSGSLRGVSVHFGYFGDPWVSDVHREKIARFWGLYLRGQGAQLGAFCGDLSTVFDALRPNSRLADSRGVLPEPDPRQAKIEMLRITREVGVADWITRDILSNTSRTPPSTTVGRMKIGIRWQGNLDLDLYATPRPQAETLNFEHTRSPEGYYFKDHRSSPQREYEFVEFETPVDVRQIQVMVNFYEGTAPEGAAGEIRIEFDGRLFSGPFSIPASQGNKGRSGRTQSEFWTRIDVPRILLLPSIEPNAAIPRSGSLLQ